MSKDNVETIINTSIGIGENRSLESIFMLNVKGLRELSKELHTPHPRSNDGIIGKCVDAILTIVDLATQDLVSRGYNGADKIIDEWCRMMGTKRIAWIGDGIQYTAGELFMIVAEAMGGLSVDLRIKSGIKNRPQCKDGILDKCIVAYLSIMTLIINEIRAQGFRGGEATNEYQRVVDAKLAKWVLVYSDK